jgi:hypothetical protein
VIDSSVDLLVGFLLVQVPSRWFLLVQVSFSCRFPAGSGSVSLVPAGSGFVSLSVSFAVRFRFVRYLFRLRSVFLCFRLLCFKFVDFYGTLLIIVSNVLFRLLSVSSSVPPFVDFYRIVL